MGNADLLLADVVQNCPGVALEGISIAATTRHLDAHDLVFGERPHELGRQLPPRGAGVEEQPGPGAGRAAE